MAQAPVLGLAITTIGRSALPFLLASAAAAQAVPRAVAIADQSDGRLDVDVDGLPFPVVVVPSGGGVSRGRNDAVAALDQSCDVVGFPNDDSRYDEGTTTGVLACFAAEPDVVAVACRLQEGSGERFRLPPVGTPLDRRTVWRAIEAGTFVRREAFDAVGGFTPDIGTGAGSPWGSGEGTDLLLRMLAAGGVVMSRPDLVVHGVGERRQLGSDELVAKHRAYARGTGHVYRVHDYPLTARARILAGPWARPWSHDPDLRLSLRLAAARSLGRWEGLRSPPAARRSPRS